MRRSYSQFTYAHHAKQFLIPRQTLYRLYIAAGVLFERMRDFLCHMRNEHKRVVFGVLSCGVGGDIIDVFCRWQEFCVKFRYM